MKLNFLKPFEFEFGLYNDNKITFHQWLWIKKEQITGWDFFFPTMLFGAIGLAVVIMITWMETREISEYDYRDVIDDQWEYDELNELIRVYYREQAKIQKTRTKAKVTRIVDE